MKRYHYLSPIILQKIGYIVFYIFHKLFVRIEFRGQENLKGLKKPIIFAGNHTSELDVTAMSLLFPFFSSFFPIYYVAATSEVFKTFGWRNYIYGGIFFNLLGGYCVYSGHKNYAISLEDHMRLLGNGNSLFIFPEGKRTLDGELSPARGGLGYMVHTTGVSVVPVAINTFYKITFWQYFTRKRKVVITILPVMKKEELITASNPTVEDFRASGQKVLDRIGRVLTK